MNEWRLKHFNEIGISDLILYEGTNIIFSFW